MKPEVELLTRFFDAINRNAMDELASFFAMDVIRVEPEGFDTSGTYRGKLEVTEILRKGRGTWAEGTCQPEDFFVNGQKVVVFLHAWVRVHGATDWSGGRFADGFLIRDGLVAEHRTFWEREEALKWAGVSADQKIAASRISP
jgi:ketosteroid isomerase-like protein